MKAHLAGKVRIGISLTISLSITQMNSRQTDEAKADMARLRAVREAREAAAAQRKAEADEKEAAKQNMLEQSSRKRAGPN